MLPLRPHLYWGGSSCPGARWPEWVPQLRKEDDMPVFVRHPTGTVAIATAHGKRHIGPTEWRAWRKAGGTAVDVTDAEYKAIPNIADRDGGLMRGAVQALGTGAMNSAMRAGAATWKPPVTLKTVRNDVAVVKNKVDRNYNRINERAGAVINRILAALADLPQATGKPLSDADKLAIAKAVVDTLAERIKQ